MAESLFWHMMLLAFSSTIDGDLLSIAKELIRGRAQIAIGLVKTYGVALAEVARKLGVSTSAISKIVKRAAQ
jgi:DNA-directed RNA polymerase specialized sigma subunit